MSILRCRIVSSVLALIMLAGGIAGSAAAAPAHQPAALQATLHGRILRVAGTNFTPGSHITIVLINARTWQTVFHRSTTASDPPPGSCLRRACGEQAPNAGSVYIETTLPYRLSPALLAMLYRTGNRIEFGRVQGQ